MVRRVLLCLSLVLTAAGCGQVNISIDPKEGELPSVEISKVTKFEVTTGSSLKKTTASGYTVTTAVGSTTDQTFQQTSGGYKVYVGVTGLIGHNQ